MTEIIEGDCVAVLPTLPERSVHTVVTSPPYWSLRDYGVPGQLGLEPTPEEYVANMVAVFREVRRVLRDDGTLWLNLGDSMNAAGRTGHGTRVGAKQGTNRASANGLDSHRPTATNLKPKDLVGVPWRVAFALQANGWYLRSDIIWSKPNPMPESVRDRPTSSHEYVFLLSKSARYYYDAAGVREPGEGYGRSERFRGDKYTNGRSFDNDGDYGVTKGGGRNSFDESGRNKRSVWTIPTQPSPLAHFATFPEALVKPCIQAGTSERGCCPECGAPWVRVVEKGEVPHDTESEYGAENGNRLARARDALRARGNYHDNPFPPSRTVGWRATCEHGAEPVPCTVLDPFAGTGTVGIVARKAGRRAVLVELNPEYVSMMRERFTQGSLL